MGGEDGADGEDGGSKCSGNSLAGGGSGKEDIVEFMALMILPLLAIVSRRLRRRRVRNRTKNK